MKGFTLSFRVSNYFEFFEFFYVLYIIGMNSCWSDIAMCACDRCCPPQSLEEIERRALLDYVPKPPKEVIIVNDSYNYDPGVSYYELTLTQPDGDERPHALLAMCDKIVTSKIFGVVDYLYCLELTEKGVPHVHMFISTSKKYLDATKVKWPYRFSLSRVRSVPDLIKYILKDVDPRIGAYCILHSVSQFYAKKEISSKKLQSSAV